MTLPEPAQLEALETMGANAAACLPEDFGGRGRTPVAGRPAWVSAGTGGPGAASGSAPCDGCG